MSAGQASDFKIYQDEVRGGVVETLTQATTALTGGSGGAIILSTQSHRGDFAKESFFKTIATLVSRRDTTSLAGVADAPLTMDEIISVKLNRKIGPVAQTRDAFRKVLLSTGQDAFSYLIGQMAGKAMQIDMLNAGLRSARAGLVAQASNLYTVPTSGTLNTSGLVSGLSKLGDAASNVVAWVMHSKPFFDLIASQISDKIVNVADVNIHTGTPVTLNRPVIVTDSDALYTDSGAGSLATRDYFTLGLTPNGIVLENSETEEVVLQDVTGLDQLLTRLQGEFAYNAGVKGFKWDFANGGVNPNDAALGTGSNWDKAVTSFKELAGIVIQSK